MRSPINSVLGLFSRDIGIDLGTANTLVMVRGDGIIINEPSIVAIEQRSRRVLAIGSEAKKMVGRTPANIVAIRPLRDGVISDFDITEKMLVYFIRKAHEGSFTPLPKPRVVVGIPSGVTEVEKRAVQEAALRAGARASYLVEEPMAAAIGAGLPITASMGSMIVDIGGGTTEVAVISLGGIVVSRSLRVAGDELDESIVAFARQRFNLAIGERMAESLKHDLGSAFPLESERSREMRGRNLLTGLPQAIEVSSIEIREALAAPLQTIIDVVKDAIDATPPELISDLMEHGVMLAGGGALLRELPRRLAEETKMTVKVAKHPMACVARGAGLVLDDLDALAPVLASTQRAAISRL